MICKTITFWFIMSGDDSKALRGVLIRFYAKGWNERTKLDKVHFGWNKILYLFGKNWQICDYKHTYRKLNEQIATLNYTSHE